VARGFGKKDFPAILYSFGEGGEVEGGALLAPAASPIPLDADRAGLFPCMDTLDGRILKLWLPTIMNFLMIPLVGAVDVFWVGRMQSSTALAAQGAAQQVFSSAFWTISFLPSLVPPLVARCHATGDKAGMQKQVGEAIVASVLVGGIGMLFMGLFATQALTLVGAPAGSEISKAAAPYIRFRALTFIPALVATVSFATFRGTMDVVTPLKITVASQLLNATLDPFFIFGWGWLKPLGVAGAALATSMSEVFSFCSYSVMMFRRGMLRLDLIRRLPRWDAIKSLLVGGLAIQLRSLAMNVTFLAVARATITMDSTGTSAAAHAITIQLWQMGGIVLLSLSSITAVLVPQSLNRKAEEGGGLLAAKHVADRLLVWGAITGITLGLLQVGCLPLLGAFTKLEDVRAAAILPSYIGAALQAINGVVFVGEGIMQGHQAFKQLAINTAIASAGLLVTLHFLGDTLVGVWIGFWVFNLLRLAGSMRHHFRQGPFAPARLREMHISV